MKAFIKPNHKKNLKGIFKGAGVLMLLFACLLAAVLMSGQSNPYAGAGTGRYYKILGQSLKSSVAAVETGKKQPLASLSKINRELKKYGKMTIAGMKGSDYDKAMAEEWKKVNAQGGPQNLSVDIRKQMDYKTFEAIIMNLDKYGGVEVYDIGDSAKKRNIYMAVLDFTNRDKPVENKPIILITGGVHAIEFAGTEFCAKFLNDIVVKAQNDPYTRLLLENVRIAAVPLVNPDARELIIQGKLKSVWKANANGIDLNRNMPSLNAGQLIKGIRQNRSIAKKKGAGYFPGYNLGSESESRAMIKFFNTWVTDKNTRFYADLHQQAGWQYYNKIFLSAASDKLSKSFAGLTNKLLKNRYPLKSEKSTYGIDGVGGTMTDYARSVAEGMVFSYKYGRLVMKIKGAEKPLIAFRDIDKVKAYYKPVNDRFVSITPEIAKAGSIGPGAKSRQLRFDEYNKYNWANFLPGTIENILGSGKVKELKQAASRE